MHVSLQKKYFQIEKDYKALLDLCAKLSDEELNRVRVEGKWTIAQILAHINTTFRVPLSYVAKKIQFPETIPKTDLFTVCKSKLLDLSLRSSLKFKAPKGVDIVPETISIEAIQKDWNQQKEEMQRFLEGFPDNLIKRNVFWHPAVGRITMQQTLSFMHAHLLHHRKQVIDYIKLSK